MKLYVIMQKATEYNDEYDAVQQEGAKIYKAYRNPPTKEQIDAAKWDAIQGKTPGYDGDNWPDDMAYVEEIEVDDNQVIQPDEEVIPESLRDKDSHKSATLYSRAGTSDKVYKVDILRERGGFVVHAAYGRRGSLFNFVPKTDVVALEEAEREFDKLVRQKQNKGYKLSE